MAALNDFEQIVFNTLAVAYPHEMYEEDTDKFWLFFQEKYPGVTREQMVEVLENTKGSGDA